MNLVGASFAALLSVIIAYLIINHHRERRDRELGPPLRLVTREELLAAGPENSTHVYLSILGHVFDVSKGRSYYGKGGSYSFFSGTDGTRAFATGDFTPEGLSESVDGLSTPECAAIQKWLKFYEDSGKYPLLGYLEGSQYIGLATSDDASSLAPTTPFTTEAWRSFQECARNGESQAEEDRRKQTCNYEFNLLTKRNKVWCDSESGLVPRKAHYMMSTGKLKEECICIPIQQIAERRDVSVFGNGVECAARDLICEYEQQ